MQKLAIFIYSLGSGGAERVVATLTPLLKLHFDVHIILMNKKISYKLEDIQIHSLEDSSPSENALLKFIKLPFLALKYRKLRKNLDIDTEFIFLNRPNYIALMARSFGSKTRLIINECTTPSVMYAKNNFNPFTNEFLIRFLHPKADLILPNPEEDREDLVSYFNIVLEKCELLCNAVNLEAIELKTKEEISLREPFILDVGRLDKGKNHAPLIRAFSKPKTNLKLVILGEGILRRESKSLVLELGLEDRVLLLGFNNNPYKYMAKCEFFVLASIFKGFSNVLIESLACGYAMVYTEHQGEALELLGRDEFGLLVEVGSGNSMLQGLKVMLENDTLRVAYKKKAKMRTLEFDKVKIVRVALRYLTGTK